MISKQDIFSLIQDRKKLLFAIIIALIIKLIGDFGFYYFFGAFAFDKNIIWKLTTTIIITILIISYFSLAVKPKVEKFDNLFVDKFINDIKNLAIIFAVGVGLLLLIPNTRKLLNDQEIPYNLIVQLFGWYFVVLSFLTARYFLRWVTVLKNSRTLKYLQFSKWAIIFVLSNIFVVKTLNYYYDIGIIVNILDTLQFFLYIYTFIVSYQLASDNNWLRYLNKSQKRQFNYLLSLTIIMASIILASTSGNLRASTDLIFPNIKDFVIYVIVVIVGFQINLIFQNRTSNKAELDQGASTISALDRFNKYILKSDILDNTELLKKFISSLSEVIQIDFSWSESYLVEGKSSIITMNGVEEKFYNFLTNSPNYQSTLDNASNTIVIAGLYELGLNLKYNNYRKSIILIPIFQGNQKTSTIIIGRNKEYAFSIGEVQIINTFVTNFAVAIQNNKLMQEAIEKQRYQFELNLAQSIQRKILPENLPELKNYSIAGKSIPANELGGDYFDFVYLRNKKPVILIADVSGKGVSAALYMAELKGIIISIVKYVDDIKELVLQLNDILVKNTEKQIFITLAAIAINDDEGEICYIRAGHTPLLVKQNGIIQQISSKGMALGLVAGKVFEENLEVKKLKLQSDDFCFAFTDGLSEMRNAENDEFGLFRIGNLLQNSNIDDAKNVLNIIIEESNKFKQNRQLVDDLTIMSLMFKKTE